MLRTRYVGTCDAASRAGAWERPARPWLAVLIAAIGVAATGGHMAADVPSSAKPREEGKRRSWAEVKAETEKVFADCHAAIDQVLDAFPRGTLLVSARINSSMHPNTCYQHFQYRSLSDRGQPEMMTILDLRIERDYSHELGAASSYRIVPNLVALEGTTMYQAVLAYLKQRRCSFEVMDPNSEEGKRLAERYRGRYASP